MHHFKKILVTIDTRLDHHPVLEKAAEVASLAESELTVVDVIPEFPWHVRMAMKDHEHVSSLIANERIEMLESLAEPIRKTGVNVKTKILTGKHSVELIREVLRNHHDVVMAVAKGKHSREQGTFGQTGSRLLRKCPCPVWLVTPNASAKIHHVLGCVDTSTDEPLDQELNVQVFELGSSISKEYACNFSIVHAWSIWNEPMLESRMSGANSFKDLVDYNQKQTEDLLNSFISSQKSAIDANNVHLIKGDVQDIVAEFTREKKVDLVVMGTVARTGLTGMTIGNTAEQILNKLECSVLAMKPSSFVSPIQLDS